MRVRGLAAGLALLLLAACGGAGAPGVPTADRGIGGTGGPALADRGIGGTGVVGTITGFGSIWVNGLEIGTGPATRVASDVGPDSVAGLRLGQVVAVAAAGGEGALQAGRIEIRHEVAGPVTRVDADGTAEVAGQRVRIGDALAGGAAIRPGAWVAVSGFRTPQGAIAATRIDPDMPGPVLVRGPVEARQGALFIGDLRLVPGTASLSAGMVATVRGSYAGAALRVRGAMPDRLATDPGAYFGMRFQRLVIEGYGRVMATRLPGFAAMAMPAGRTVVTLARRPGGGFRPVRAIPAEPFRPGMSGASPAPRAGLRFTPAPTPSERAMPGGRTGGIRPEERHSGAGWRDMGPGPALGTGPGTAGPPGGGPDMPPRAPGR